MATQHNTFIRKFGNHAIIMTVTDWKDFEVLSKMSASKHPDFLVSAITTKTIYSNMLPNILVDVSTARDITEGTKGMGLSGILTGGCGNPGSNDQLKDLVGGIWGYKSCGLTYSEQMINPTFKK